MPNFDLEKEEKSMETCWELESDIESPKIELHDPKHLSLSKSCTKSEQKKRNDSPKIEEFKLRVSPLKYKQGSYGQILDYENIQNISR